MKTSAFISFSCLGLLFLTSCVSGDYTVPTLRDELKYEETENYQIDKEWWKLYGNGELDRLVDLALQRNPDYLKSALKVERERYVLRKSDADLFPTLSGSLGASADRKINTHDDFHKKFSGEVGIKYELDLYGKIRDANSAEEFEMMATVLDKDAAELSLVNSVVDLFYNLEYLNNAIELTKGNIKTYEDLCRIAENKNANGKIDDLEVVQAKRSLLSEKNKLLDLEMKFKDNENSLRNILGYRQDEVLDVKYGNLLEHKDIDVDLDLPMYVLANRPDLKAAQYRVEKAFKHLRAEDKSWYPSITLKGALNSSSEKFRDTFEIPYIFGSIAISLPFLDWTRVYSNIKISEADYNLAVIGFKDTLNRAVNELAYYYYAYRHTKTLFENMKNNYENTKKITGYYLNRYEMGKAEFKDFLEAMNAENSIHKEIIQQKYQIVKYENNIYKSLAGRYVKKDAAAPAGDGGAAAPESQTTGGENGKSADDNGEKTEN